ncbi:MAG: hypothetical protein HRU15_14575 [Planctomycetes bacterium]|nr:hypothetical protein [Planctomycetota bacterium]
MTDIDQFESVFRAAAKDVFEAQEPAIESVVVFYDEHAATATDFVEHVRSYVSSLANDVSIIEIADQAYNNVESALKIIAEHQPDLIVCYRHLKEANWDLPHGLGSYVHVFTQATAVPVLVVPHPRAGHADDHAMIDRNKVMALTDHVTRDHSLVNWSLKTSDDKAELFLCHIEDDQVYQRYIEAIGKIPTLDTAIAQQTIMQRLLKDAEDYIHSCAKTIKLSRPQVQVQAVVQAGHHLKDFQDLVAAHKIDLLVMNSNDQDHHAMHGLIYPLAVSIRSIPLLLL